MPEEIRHKFDDITLGDLTVTKIADKLEANRNRHLKAKAEINAAREEYSSLEEDNEPSIEAVASKKKWTNKKKGLRKFNPSSSTQKSHNQSGASSSAQLTPGLSHLLPVFGRSGNPGSVNTRPFLLPFDLIEKNRFTLLVINQDEVLGVKTFRNTSGTGWVSLQVKIGPENFKKATLKNLLLSGCPTALENVNKNQNKVGILFPSLEFRPFWALKARKMNTSTSSLSLSIFYVPFSQPIVSLYSFPIFPNSTSTLSTLTSFHSILVLLVLIERLTSNLRLYSVN